jgi:RimJ/RimL family protein N-acetyltransferase
LIVIDHARVGKWVCDKTGGTFEHTCSTSIGLERNGELIAGVLFDNFNGRSINMHVASDGSRGWMNREYLWYCFHYPFEQLGVKRITGLVAASNEDAMKFDTHLGFIHEATLKDAAPDGDLHILRMFKDECRFLRIRHGTIS